MKIRSGFVSNSSSASFVLLEPTCSFKQTLPDIPMVLLDQYQKEVVLKRIMQQHSGNVYLTPYRSDAGDYTEPMDNCGLVYHQDYFKYDDGAHSGPYSDEHYEKLNDPKNEYEIVWMRYEDYWDAIAKAREDES